eukprot:scaffold204665_cov33-Tisochrysis_lutea.AAC.3
MDRARRRGVADVERLAQVEPASTETAAHYSAVINAHVQAVSGQSGMADWTGLFIQAMSTAKDERLGLDSGCAHVAVGS